LLRNRRPLSSDLARQVLGTYQEYGEVCEHPCMTFSGPVAAPPLKWLAWLLAAVSFASGVTSVYVSLSITAHHLAARWKTEHILPEAPAIVAFLLGAVVVLWLDRYHHWRKYRKTERIGLGIVLAWLCCSG
jgi:hypothetical protein